MCEQMETESNIWLKPVGVVESSLTSPGLRADGEKIRRTGDDRDAKRRAQSEVVARLVVDRELDGILDGIEEFSHILVLYWPHLVPRESRSLLKVHPRGREDLPKKGIFSTCSPARPNPVLVTAVELLERRENVLVVKGLEAVDGSPLLDIKPYMPHYHRPEHVEVAPWVQR